MFAFIPSCVIDYHVCHIFAQGNKKYITASPFIYVYIRQHDDGNGKIVPRISIVNNEKVCSKLH